MSDAALVKAELKRRAEPVEDYLRGALKGRGIPCTLLEAMEYSLGAGGKRLRPVLCLSAAGLCGLGDTESILPFAGALECIHTYSLVHDDLPAMDNDDLRRGKPSNHKVFGEAMAILAGDALLTEAFVLMAEVGRALPPERVLAALAEVAKAAGAVGMVGGQAQDMLYTGKADVTLPMLQEMHARKTGALITCSCVSGAHLAGAGAEAVAKVRRYGEHLGVAFQIADDILDVVGTEAELGKPVGSDEGQGKNTYPSLVGLDRSRELANEQAALAVAQLEGFTGPDANFLTALARYVVERVN